MNNRQKVTDVAHDLYAAAFAAPKMGGVDNLEDLGDVVENPDGSVMRSFKMTEFVTAPRPAGHRGPGSGQPLGEMQYTVTVVGKFVPYDDE